MDSNLNQLAPIDFNEGYILGQQPHESGYRASTFDELSKWLNVRLDLQGAELIDPTPPGTSESPAIIPSGSEDRKGKFEPEPGFYQGFQEVTSDRRWYFYWDMNSWSLKDMGELPNNKEYIDDNFIKNERINSPEGVAGLNSDGELSGNQLPIELGASPNGQLYNRATNTHGVVLASAVPSTVLEDYIVAGVGGQNSKLIPVVGSTNYTFSWDGTRPNRRTLWLKGNMEVISFIGDWGNNQTRQSPPEAAFFIFCAKRNDATEPTEDVTIKFEQGDSKTAGTTYGGGIEKIGGYSLKTDYAENANHAENSNNATRALSAGTSDIAIDLNSGASLPSVGNYPLSVINRGWLLSQLELTFPNGQLYNRLASIPNVSMALPSGGSTVIEDYILPSISGGLVSQPMPVEEGKPYTMSWNGSFANRRGIWIDKDFNVIEFVSQWANNQTRTAPVGAKWYIFNPRRSASLEPTEDVTIKFEQSSLKTPDVEFKGVVKKISSLEVGSGDSVGVTTGKIYAGSKIFLAKGIELPIYKSSLQWENKELKREYIFGSFATSHTDFGLPMYRTIDYAGARINFDQVGDNFRIFSKDFQNSSETDLAVSGVIEKVDPSTIGPKTINFLGIGDSNTYNLFNPAVRPRILNYAPNVTFNQFGGRGSSASNRHEFRSGWGYSSFTGRQNRFSASSVLTPYEVPADLSNTSKNSFIRIATQADKDNTPQWCFRNSGQYQELSYLEDSDKSGDFWIFDFSLYLSRIGNPSLDLIYIHLVSNDITRFGNIDNAELCCRLMLTKIREVLPDVKIGVGSSIGRGENSGDQWKLHCDWIDRLNIIMEDFPGIDVLPLYMHINRNFSYPYDNEELVNENGNLTSTLTKGDQIHIGVTGSGEFGDAVASWVLNSI